MQVGIMKLIAASIKLAKLSQNRGNFIRENIQCSYQMAQTGVDAIEEGLTDDMRRVKDLLFGDTNSVGFHIDTGVPLPYQDGILPRR